MSSQPKSDITLYFLGASRSIRIAWLLEELSLPYRLVSAERENQKAPQWLKDEVGGLGKFPALKDGTMMFYESGNIVEYLCDRYDTQHRLLPPPGDVRRYQVLQWVHAAEGTFMLHAVAILYARWQQKDGDVAKTEAGLKVNVEKDFDWLESELGKSSVKFLVGDTVTAADVMMEFSIDFILKRKLGIEAVGDRWKRIGEYLQACQATDRWKEAQRKTGHEL